MSVPAATWVDGARADALPLPDRGLAFGDGLFETLLLQGGSPLYPQLHRQRLQRGLRALGLEDGLTAFDRQLAIAGGDATVREAPWAALRITLSRGAGPRGYAPPTEPIPRVIAEYSPLERDAAVQLPPARLGIAELRWGEQPALAGLKHLNRLEQVLAAQQARREGWDDAVMLDQRGRVISTGAGNLFALWGGQLITPPLESCGIQGTRRQLVLEHWAPALGITTAIEPLSLQQLLAADEVFLTNALVTLRPVAALGQRQWSGHALCHALFDRFIQELP